MKFKNNWLIVLLIAMAWSCKKDDDGPQVEQVPPRLLSEVVVENDAEIVAFLKSHFYNYEEFQSPSADFDFRIRFDTIAGDNSEKISIFDSPNLNSETINVKSSEFGETDGEEIDHKLYYLVARQGGSAETPTIGDNVALRYEGLLVNGDLFDSSTSQPVQFNLSGVVRGFGNGMEYFNSGTAVVENGDGTFTYEDYGIGAIFIPSGLGYFNNPPSNLIPPYTSLIFKIDSFFFQKDTDLDGDGIPSSLEDLDGNGNLNDDNTDSADEIRSFVPNYQDADDDNDGIPTREEINLNADGSFLSFKDTDGDGISDHLDIN